MKTRTVLLAAGGTGGHLFPAASLGQELQRRGYAVELATDMRAEKYGGDFPARHSPHLSATLTSRSPLAVAATFTRLGFGYAGALRMLLKLKPYAVIGFGGYPTLPPIIAASIPHPDGNPRAERGDGTRQSTARAFRRSHRPFMPTKLLAPEAQAKAR